MACAGNSSSQVPYVPEQENNEIIIEETIANINVENPFIPLILMKFGEEEIPCLLDIGSSISLMSQELFDSVKQNIKYKFLGRSVSISTINSKVKFSGCASISFKIEKQHLRHNIYVSEIGENSPFAPILGYDFILKYNILIFPEMGSCKINSEFICFHNHQPRDNKKIKDIFQNHIHMKNLIEEKKNEEILKNSQLTKFINAPPFVPENWSFGKLWKSQII